MYAAMRGTVLLLIFLWAGAEVAAINLEVLANVVQQMRTFGLENQQYAMAVRLTQQQCTDKSAGFDLGVKPEVVQRELRGKGGSYLGERIIAAIPKNFHAEYLLLERDSTKPSPVSTLLGKANANECIVFFSTYSPCLERCNNPNGQYNIIPFLKVFNTWNENKKAFVFSSVWEPARHHHVVTNPTREDVLQSFRRINPFIPLYRCVRYQGFNECHVCVTPNTNAATNACLYGY